jgi:hydrogenase maturation protease
MKTIVLGVGNPILRDDGVGIHVINSLRHQIKDQKIHLDVAYTGGMNLLDKIRGYEKVILVDAVKQEGRKPGTVKRFTLLEMPSVHSSNPHDVSLTEAMHLAQQLGETNLPKDIIVVGIVVQNTLDFGEHLSSKVAEAIPIAVRMVLSELQHT